MTCSVIYYFIHILTGHDSTDEHKGTGYNYSPLSFWALKITCIYTCTFLHKGMDLLTSISRAVPAPTAVAQVPMIGEFQF